MPRRPHLTATAAAATPAPRCPWCGPRYEDVLHEGNLDEDTPHEDAPAPDADETGAIADYDRRKRK